MKRILLLITAIVFVFQFLSSCRSIPSNTQIIHHLSFMQGEWETNMEGIVFVEKYSQVNDSTMSGESKLISDGQALYTERIKIEVLNGKVYYRSSTGEYVIEQGKTLPVTKIGKKSVTFGKTEKEHTYLKYTLKKDGLELEMQDNAEGSWVKEKYLLKKK